jgi:hypothetical protein
MINFPGTGGKSSMIFPYNKIGGSSNGNGFLADDDFG